MTDTTSIPPQTSKINPLLAAALDYAARGWHVLPLHTPLFDAAGKCTGCTCEAYARSEANRKRLEAKGRGGEYNPNYVCSQPGKHPNGYLAPHWVDDATTDEKTIRSWWKRNPSANVGIACGASGLIALDADTYKDNFAGDLSALDMETVTSLTGGGGAHLLYRMPEGATYGNGTGDLEAGIDIRGHGGQIAAPPSLHPSGRRYQWESGYAPGEIAVAPMPEKLRARLDATARTASKEAGPPDSEAVARSVDLVKRVLLTGNMAHGNPVEYGNGGRRVNLAKCPFNPPDDPHTEDGSAVVIVRADGTIVATCNHNRCKQQIAASGGKGWAMLREMAGAGTEAHTNQNGASEPPPEDDGYIPQEPPPMDDAPLATPKPAGKAKGKGKAKSEAATDAAGESWGPSVKCTDLGNARRLVRAHGVHMRYCYAWRAWLTWDGKRWNRDDAGKAMRYAKSTVAGIYAEASGKATADARTEIGKWAIKSESRDRLGAMIELAQSELTVQPDDLDTDHTLLNVANGTLNLRTGMLQPHRPEDLITKLTPIPYDPMATCPLWDAFLWRIMDGSDEKIDYLQRAVGYALTGDVSEQVLFYLYGKGANGKSTFLTTILAMLGKDYATQAAPELLTQGDRHPTEIADLRGLRFVASTEIEDGRRMAEGLVKQMTGGDVLKARFMRGDFFQFEPTHKLFLAANHKLVIKGTDHAIWRRIKLIPFIVTIPDNEKDVRLPEKLRAELPGILAWAVRGCAAWYARGLDTPADVIEATGDYRSEMDTLGRYLEECTVKAPGATVQAKPLYADYCTWYKASGEKEKDMLTMTAFGRALGDRGLTKAQDRTRITFYQDLGLLSTPGLLDNGAGGDDGRE